jgi:thymidylate kinase
MRILVDGMDLSGKTTLAKALVAALQARGIAARRNVGGLHKGWLDAFAQWAYRRCRPGSVLVSWLFAGVMLADALRARHRASEVVMQEAYAEHTIAFAEGFGRRAPAWVVRALRRWLPRFDRIVVLTAGHQERVRRFGARGQNDAVDALLLAEPWRLGAIEHRLRALLAGPRTLWLDTDRLGPRQVLDLVLQHVLPAPEAVAPGAPAESGREAA